MTLADARYDSDIKVPLNCANSPGARRHLCERVDMSNATCSVNDCERLGSKRGMCNMHYKRWRTTGATGPAQRLKALPYGPAATCVVEGCESPIRALGWCAMHHQRVRLTGQLGSVEPLKKNGREQNTGGQRICTSCRTWKPLSEYSVNNRLSDGLSSYCRPCIAARRVRQKYGLTPEEYQAQLEAQEGRCAACGAVPEEGLFQDHCHDSGRVRELLCRGCNTAIGFLKDDPDRALAAAAYLRKWAHFKGGA